MDSKREKQNIDETTRFNMLSKESQNIMMVGNWHWDIYEEALAAGFQANGWVVIPFNVENHLSNSLLANYLIRARLRTAIAKLNNSMINTFRDNLPTAVFFHRPELVISESLRIMKTIKPDVVLILYHNDNPFLGLTNRIKMRHYLASIPFADVTLVYRPSNLEDARRYGARYVELFLPYYVSYLHKPIRPSSSKESFDVIYIGHYEADGREKLLDYLVQNGVRIRIFGTGWEKTRKKYSWLDRMDIRRVSNFEYSRLLCASQIALVFLSSRHRDVYTRRCFEITACGTLMMAPRTHELEQLFTDGKEAIYYDSKEDLLEKIHYYLMNNDDRYMISQAGRHRCVNDGQDEVARARQIIETIVKKRK
jgi:hypothetical protein